MRYVTSPYLSSYYTNIAISIALTVFLVVSAVGLSRYGDRLHHPKRPCQHRRGCAFYDGAGEEDESSTSLGASPPKTPWYARAALWAIRAVAEMLFSPFLGIVHIYRLGADARKCDCPHITCDRLREENFRPAPGSEGGRFSVVSGVGGFSQEDGVWLPGVRVYQER
jgi:hypothetical protein